MRTCSVCDGIIPPSPSEVLDHIRQQLFGTPGQAALTAGSLALLANPLMIAGLGIDIVGPIADSAAAAVQACARAVPAGDIVAALKKSGLVQAGAGAQIAGGTLLGARAVLDAGKILLQRCRCGEGKGGMRLRARL